ncbi:cyclic nucleotide-binding protein [Leptospira kobayashii]|uniref:Cyclic nucleotide-binding protein n=1 Tax=Leptospira kobayashii TaxID=1917830 RepID=A0ABM7UIZ0_9LEPT|nr:Crp/Fnr family transcriptional regulator [Leptospira kobayashii]BDA78640.1 cyclic nucleotide-binding protein [Leptospira kobayashii]
MQDFPIFNQLKERVPSLNRNWKRYYGMLQELSVPAKTTLIRKGENNKTIYFIKKGCLRIWFEDKNKDVTIAFFFENRAIGSLHAYRGTQNNSQFSLESIEPTDVYVLSAENAEIIYRENEKLKEVLLDFALERFDTYMNLFLSRIRDSPEVRYRQLIKNQPDIVERIPQHYIASYLGITAVSLSRIRNRVWKDKK